LNGEGNIHEYPELSNHETNTGKYIADHLKALGLDVQYPVSKTGVVGILKGAKPDPSSRCEPTWMACR